MDNLDNTTPTPDEQTQNRPADDTVAPQASQPAPPQPSEYCGAGKGKKESPYANSPYVMNRPQQYNPPYYYQQPYQAPQYQAPQYQAPQYQVPQQPQYAPQQTPPVKEKPRKEKKPRRPIWGRLLAAILIVALVAGGCITTGLVVNNYWEGRNAQTVATLTDQISTLQRQINALSERPSGTGISGTPAASGSAMTPGQVYTNCVNSVVAISSTVQAADPYGISEGTATGSGFILSQDGYVITNYHVIEGATAVSVITHDGSEYPAQVVGHDATNDLAVLKIEAEGLNAVVLGSSNALSIGDMVVAIGNPLGELTSTQTVGYVSGINREVATDSTIINMIQTDAAINPGNSGGPLFNMNGEVVGITTAKYSGTTTSGASIEGIGFAIPIDDVTGIIRDLIDFGYVTGAYLGVTVQNTDAQSAAMFGLPTGAYVLEVVEGYAADRAGIRVKDTIISLGGYPVSSITDLTRALRNFKAGDTTTVTVIRSGGELTLTITLDEKPQVTDTPVTPEPEPDMPEQGEFEEWYDYFRRYFGE